jgi:acyl-CoA synthetase (AMP-forming)/AMP-acid ligase II
MVIPMGSDKIESIGRPAPWIDVRLVDDGGKIVADGAVGEITLKSWVVMKGYYQDPEMTAEVIKDGWLHTGDLARRDKDGLYYIVGRKRDMIKVSGQLVFPSEVEEVLHKHPRVSEAAVVGVPDSIRGEIVKAFVVSKDKDPLSAQDIKDFCRAHLAHFKMPHDIQFMDALPKNRAGKVDKVSLKQPIAR